MIGKLLYLPVRCIVVIALLIYAGLYYTVARLFNKKKFDLGTFYQKNFERLGGTYIKVGQVLSVRYDVLPEAQCKALAKLQDKVKPFNAAKGVRIIRKEIGEAQLEGLAIEEEPFASGSLCQVYKARGADGNWYAIKVKRPLIEAKLFADTFFLKLVKYALIISGVGKRLGAYRLVDEVIDVLKDELDYSKEARHIELFEALERKVSELVVPSVYYQLSSNRILTMDLLEGTPLSDYLALDNDQKTSNNSALCNKIYALYIQCIFKEGTFHADPHPGNIFLMDDGRIGLVDYGIIGVLNRKMRQKNFHYLLALSKAQTEKAAEIYASILIANDDSDLEGLLSDTKLELDLYLKRVQDPGSGLAEKSSASLYMNSIAYARKHNFTFPENVFLFYKTLFTLDSILLRLCPDFDAKSQTSKVLGDIAMDNALEEFRFDNVMEKVQQLPELLAALPELLKRARSTEADEDARKTRRARNIFSDGTRVLATALILSAVVFPLLYYTNMQDAIEMSNLWVATIAVAALITGLRLKQ